MKISIIIPVYNVEKYLRECLDSVKNQTIRDIQVILVDDGSTDLSGVICDTYAAADKRFQVIHKKNEGAWKARNTGLGLAEGDYIGFIDADDWVDETMYENLYQEIKETQPDIVVCKKNIYDEITGHLYAERPVLKGGIYKKETYQEVMENLFCLKWGKCQGIGINLYDKVFRRDLVIKNHSLSDPRLKYFEDAACVIRCFLEADSVSILNQPLYYYRQRTGSICHTQDKGYLEQIHIFYHNIREVVEKYSCALAADLDEYIVNRLFDAINGMMGLRLKKRIPFYIPPLAEMESGDRIVIYGAGMVGQDYYRMMELMCPERIAGWVDCQYKKLQEKGMKVYSIQQLKTWDYDKILIGVLFEESAEKIRENLMEMGISGERIIWKAPSTVLDE